MSLSPVTGTEVSETANGVVTPVLSGNGPQIPASVKYGGSRASPSGDHSEDTGNYVDVEGRDYDVDGSLEMYNHERTSASPSLTPNTISDSETFSRDFPKGCEPPGAVPPRDPALSHQQGVQASSDRQQTVTEKLHESTDSPEEEEDGGEKEKQDEEEDEKTDNKWIQPHAGGRTKAEVGEL